MSQAWSKVRSFVRGAFATPEPAADTQRPAPTTARPTPTPPASPIYRDIAATTGIEPPSEQIRNVDLKADAIRARLDALEARLRDQAEYASTPLAPERVPDERIEGLAGEIAVLRGTLEGIVRQQAATRELAEELARHLADLSTTLATVDRRSVEAARDVKDAQASADEAMASVEQSQTDFAEWVRVRRRDVGQRLAPLYVLSLIALLAAFGAAIMEAVRMFE